MRLGLRERRPDLGVEPPGRRRLRPHADVAAGTSVVAVDGVGVVAQARAGATSRSVSAIVRGFQRTSGSCHAIGRRALPSTARPSSPSSACDRRAHLARQERVGPRRELGVDGEALAESLAACGCRGAQSLDRRPWLLGVHVVGGDRRDAAPVVDAGVEQPQTLGVGSDRFGGACRCIARPEHDAGRRDGGQELLVARLGRGAHRGAGLRAEVLHDHLLHVAIASVQVADREQGLGALALGLADADEDAGGERHREPAGVLDRAQPHGRHLVGRAEVRPSPGREAIARGLEHDAHRRADVLQARDLLVAHHARVQVRQQARSPRSLGSRRPARSRASSRTRARRASVRAAS